MSLMDRFRVLAEKAESGVDRDILERAFAGSILDSMETGMSDIADVVVWDEGEQSAILFLDGNWNVSDFSWTDGEEDPDFNWRPVPEMAEFFSKCIAYAREKRIPLDECGCADACAGRRPLSGRLQAFA